MAPTLRCSPPRLATAATAPTLTEPKTASSPRLVVALIRHGHYEQPAGMPSAHLPHPLTERGREQVASGADKLATMIATHGWAVHPQIHCSTLLRAWETAWLLREHLAAAGVADDMMLVETAALAERGVGAAANLTMDEIAEVVARDPRYGALPEGWKSNSFFRLPFIGAESLLDAGRRAADYIERVAAEVAGRLERDTVLLVVGHGGAHRHTAVHLGALALGWVRGLSMYHADPVCIARLAPGRYERVAGQWKVRDAYRATLPRSLGGDAPHASGERAAGGDGE